jgi:hypothetical protein
MNMGESLNNAIVEIQALRTEYGYATGRTMTIARNSLIISIMYVCNLELNNILTILGDYYGCSDNIYLIISEYRAHILENYSIYSRLLLGDLGVSTNNLTTFRSNFYEFLFDKICSKDADEMLYYLKQRGDYAKLELSTIQNFYNNVAQIFIEDNMIKPGVMSSQSMNVRIVNGEWMRIKIPSDFAMARGIYSGPGIEATTSSTIRGLILDARTVLENNYLGIYDPSSPPT